MVPTPYKELNQVLDKLLARLETILSGNFVGLYLQGSFAIGDFDEHSDVDFIVVVNGELSSAEVDALQQMHDQVYRLDTTWAQHLEGSYFPRETLRHPPTPGDRLWYLDHGARSLIRSDHCNTLVVRWTVRERGVALAGPPPKSLVDPITREQLQAEIYETLNDWGQEILNDPSKYNNRFYQGFIVLNYCRMLHDLRRGAVGSKREGAEWAKSNLDPAWHDLIDGAWDGRPNPAQSVREPADPLAFARTLEFLAYVMDRSRRLFATIFAE